MTTESRYAASADPPPLPFSAREPHSARRTIDGTLWIFLAEALLLPTGLLTAAFLTRRLGAEGYGLFTLAATLVSWIEWSITSVFARAAIKFVSEAEDWKPVGATVARLHLLVSLAVAGLLCLLAGPLATLLGDGRLALYLRLFALDIPLFALAQAHRNILVGVGGFRQRALATAGRWTVRLVLIVALVAAGLSVTGAILGSIGASLAELVLCRLWVRPALLRPSSFAPRRLWDYALPLFLFSLSMRLFDKLDLFTLSALGGTTAAAGVYAAAQNLALIPGLFAMSFSPLLLSNVSRAVRAGDLDGAQAMSRNAMRLILVLLPFVALLAGAAPEIVVLIFGAPFAPAAPLLSILLFGALALALGSVTTAVLTAADKPAWPFALTGPLLPLALAGHLWVIPRFGATGAAWVTTSLACAGAVATVVALYRLWRVLPPAGTFCRSVVLGAAAYAAATLWPTPDWLVAAKLLVLGLAIPPAFAAAGELGDDEARRLRGALGGRRAFPASGAEDGP